MTGNQYITLEKVAQVFNGKTPSKSEQRISGYPVLKIKDVDENGNLKRSFDSFVDDEFYQKHKSKCIHIGDTLILNAAHNAEYVSNKIYFATDKVENAIATGEWLIIRPDKKYLDSRFIHYWIRSGYGRKTIKDLVKGIHLYPNDVKRIKIPLPPLPIQKKIAEVLERADASWEKRRQANALTEQFLQSVFLEMFGDPAQNHKKWKTLTILEVISKQKHSIVRGPFGGALKKEIFVPDGYKVYEQKNAIKNDFEIGTYYIDEEKYNSMQSFAIVPNDLIISCSGTIGKVAIVPKDAKPGIINQALMKISLDESKALPVFMKYLLETDHLQRLFFGSAEGSAIKNVKPLKEIKLKCFPLPPLKEQIKFSELVQKIDFIQRRQKESDNELEELFQSLMQKAFKGELKFNEKELV